MTDARAEPVRHRLAVRLAPPVGTSAPPPRLRHPVEADVPALGRLMGEAYRGKADERGAGTGVTPATEEIGQVFDGVRGTYPPETSFVAGENGRPVATALVTVWNGGPLLASVFTGAANRGRGLARRLIAPAAGAPARRGHARPNLAVTGAYAGARALYESMGSAEVPEGGERAAGG